MQTGNTQYIKRIILKILILSLSALSLVALSQVNTQPTIKPNNAQKKAITTPTPPVAGKTTTQKKANKNTIDSEINYTAQDSIVFLGNGTGFLHGKSDIKYKNIELKAEFIRLRMDSSLVYARGKKDSIGQPVGEPQFSEGTDTYNSKELTYNLETKKGFIRQAVTQQGEGYIISDKTKKTQDESLCIAGGKYTTCDNHDHPDFYLSLSKAKVKPGSYIVAGPAHLVVQDVPLPIFIPFGFFPFTNKYSSGILIPNFTDELTRGFGLTNGGYYFALSDYADLELRGDIYTKGTWAVNTNTSYRKRYKYNGNFAFSYREDVSGEKELSDYFVAKNMSLQWSHTQDQKANPYFNFSSSVNFSTSGYNRSNINSVYNPVLVSENTKSSSVSFTKRFPESPFNITGSILVNQQTRDSSISMTLPNINVSMSRIYPFKRKNAIGKDRWYEKISVSYSGVIANSISTKENQLLGSSLTRDWKNGVKHSIPVSATFNLLKYINVSPSLNYTERWYTQSYNQSWDASKQTVKTDTLTGFYRVYDFNTGVSASTKLYGYYIPLRKLFGDKIDRIRHVITPTIGLSYAPDFGDAMWGYYGSYQKQVLDASDGSAFHYEDVRYSHYNGALYGAPGTGKTGSVNFSIANNLEMKVRNDKDTTGNNPFKKISLIDNFALSSSYNMAADSMRWSYINASLRLKFGKNYNLSLSGNFDPYMYGLNKYGNPVRINELRWNHGKFPAFLGTGTSVGYTFNNETFSKLFGNEKSESTTASPSDNHTNRINGNQPNSQKESTSKEKPQNTTGEDGYQRVSIPWSLSVNYSVRYSQNTAKFNKQKMEYEMMFTHNLSLSGNIALTNNWKFNGNTSYDFENHNFPYTSINIVRNLHCWTMTGGLSFWNGQANYNMRIGVNASMLQDLKYEKRSSYGANTVNWY